VTWEPRWLDAALELQHELDAHYRDAKHGGYFMTADDGERLLSRDKPVRDGSLPSGNSYELSNLLRLAEITSDDRYRERAEQAFAAFSHVLSEDGPTVPWMVGALDAYLGTPREIVIVAPDESATAEPLLARLRTAFVPDRVLVVTTTDRVEALARRIPLLAGKRALHGETTAFVCERGRCQLPTSDPEEFARQLAAAKPLSEGGVPAPLPIPAAPPR
jgi:uncharacterized protein YyaL (SSP411 family)